MQPASSWAIEVNEALRLADGYVVWDPACDANKPNAEAHPDPWTVAVSTWWPVVQNAP